jgi:hypothetical protein
MKRTNKTYIDKKWDEMTEKAPLFVNQKNVNRKDDESEVVGEYCL